MKTRLPLTSDECEAVRLCVLRAKKSVDAAYPGLASTVRKRLFRSHGLVGVDPSPDLLTPAATDSCRAMVALLWPMVRRSSDKLPATVLPPTESEGQ